MNITIKPKNSFYKNFPEYKGKKVEFIKLEKDANTGGGYMLTIYADGTVADFSIEYFILSIAKTGKGKEKKYV